jgi:translation initiation factor 2 alpha subunit (eIF-2alpha)
MESFKFYQENKPKIGEIVQVVFTQRNDDHATGHLTEYEGTIIMSYSQATKKKKIRSINKLIPLDKPTTVIIEDFDNNKNIGNVSKAYLDDVEDNYNDNFVHNNKLINIVYQICQKKGIDFKSFWKETLLPFILSIKDDKEEDEENTTSTNLNNLITNIDKFNSIVKNDFFCDEIKNKFINIKKNELIKKTIGIVSNEGVDNTKKLFEMSLDENDYKENISIKYSNTPNFLIETRISESYLDDFCQLLQKNSKTFTSVYVKIN